MPNEATTPLAITGHAKHKAAASIYHVDAHSQILDCELRLYPDTHIQAQFEVQIALAAGFGGHCVHVTPLGSNQSDVAVAKAGYDI